MTSYSTVQKQQLSQLGAYLQEKRQEQGKSLEDISLQTYIRAQLLKALESGDTSDLPQPIFVQGFIRRYADALGLDGTNFSKQFPVHSIPNTPRPVARPATPIDMAYRDNLKPPVSSKPAVGALPLSNQPTNGTGPSGKETDKNGDTATARDLPLNPQPMSESELAAVGLSDLNDSTSPQPEPPSQSSPFVEEKSSTTPPVAPEESSTTPPIVASEESFATPSGSASAMPSRPVSSGPGTNWLPVGIGAAVLAGAISLIGPRLIGGSDQPPAPTEAESPADVEQSADVEPLDTAQPAPIELADQPQTTTPETPISDAPVYVQVEITEAGPSWMSVVVDDSVVFEGLLDPGTKEIWEGQTSINMNVGNAGAALISANGSEPQPAGNPGGAEFLTFTPTDNSAE